MKKKLATEGRSVQAPRKCVFLWQHVSFVAFLCFCLPSTGVQAQHRHHHETESRHQDVLNPCYNASDMTEIRLWDSVAPGAVGNDPCRDIPYLQAFHAAHASRTISPAILIIPGGGYDRLTDTREQAPVAKYFSSQLDIKAFVLRYRLVQTDGTYRYPTPLWDGQRAIRLLRAHASELGIDPSRIAVFGFSAGGHLASTLAIHPDKRFGAIRSDPVDEVPAEVNLLGLGYPVISMNPAVVPPSGSYRNLLFGLQGRELEHLQHFLSGEENVTSNMPPTFLFESLDDKKISPQNSQLFVAALQNAGVPHEAHIFSHGEHGSGLSIGIEEEEAWPSMFDAWIRHQWPALRTHSR